MRVVQSLIIAASPALLACKPSVAPHDMSVAQHEAAAAAEEEHADDHEAEFDPDARELDKAEDCVAAPGLYDTCWSVIINPTRPHLADADEHRARAKQHRKAAQKLVAAEARACDHLEEYDRDLSPFFHAPDIESVRVAHDEVDVVFRPTEGLNRPKMERLIECHRARNAALGHERPDMDYCPLVPDNITTRVSTKDGRVHVAVHSDDPAGAREVVSRAKRLEQRVHESHHGGAD